MGRRGPAPEPTALRVLKGNPAKRPLPKAEPKPELAAPVCPSWLDPEAKREWEQVAPMLLRLGLLTEADGAALAAYCQAYATWQQAARAIREDGVTILNPSGALHANPAVSVMQRSLELVRKFAQEFGMTPSARGRMVMAGRAEEADEMEGMLR